MEYTYEYLDNINKIIKKINKKVIDKVVDLVAQVKQINGRIFFIGNGGSAANCSHAVNDFRKIAGIECYAPTDNVAELTARTNDNGWETVFSDWLEVSKLRGKDLVFILSVGGGTMKASNNIKLAIEHCKKKDVETCGIVGANPSRIDYPIIIPNPKAEYVESFQSILLHLIANHPKLKEE